jgi:hypothetical protein
MQPTSQKLKGKQKKTNTILRRTSSFATIGFILKNILYLKLYYEVKFFGIRFCWLYEGFWKK